jgi:hypothetical protein
MKRHWVSCPNAGQPSDRSPINRPYHHNLSPKDELKSRSGGEAFSTRTTAGCVGVSHLETSLVERLHKVQFAARHVQDTLGIDDDANAGAFHDDIAVGRGVLEIHFVLEPGTSAAHDGDAQDTVGRTPFLQELEDFATGGWRDANNAFVAKAISGCGRFGCGIRCNHTVDDNEPSFRVRSIAVARKTTGCTVWAW